jgi:hypothetical protein
VVPGSRVQRGQQDKLDQQAVQDQRVQLVRQVQQALQDQLVVLELPDRRVRLE